MFDAWDAPTVDLAPVDEILTITMLGDSVLLRPTGPLDRLRTGVFADVLNAAALAGSVVTLVTESEPAAPTDELATSAAFGANGEPPLPADVEVVRGGVIRVPVGDTEWTIDVNAGRFVRGNAGLDTRFLTDGDWTPYRTIWLTPSTLTAVTATGGYLHGPRPIRTAAVH